MTAKISAEEKAIIDYVESDLSSSVDNVESEKKTLCENCTYANE